MPTADVLLTSQQSLRWLPVAVARLGDADVRGWWRSHGMDSTGEYVLSDLFPRTWQITGAEVCVLSAAKRHHDALPQRSDVLHLFGEPFSAFRQSLAWLAELKTGGDTSALDQLRSWTASSADDGLRTLLGPPATGERIGATLRLGQVNPSVLTDPHEMLLAARSLASAYIDQADDLHIPYFDIA